jgi:predicted alpha-1,6-mannanase (GH76 family)
VNRRRWIVVVTAAVLGAAILISCGSVRPLGAAVPGTHLSDAPSHAADTILKSFNDAFLMRSNGAGNYRLSTAGGNVTFFKQAELIEMTEDAYLRSGNPDYKTMIGVLYRGLVARHGSGSRWLSMSDDDLMWATIMCMRAYKITGDKKYLLQAKVTFDASYARTWSPDLGGGLWNAHRDGKNTCLNAPAVIAAGMLYRSLHDASYLAKAKQLYGWLRKTLYVPATGAVYDHISPPSGAAGGAVIDRTTWTYNAGGFIGAANMLYGITADRQYYDDALRALQYTKSNLTVGGILKSEVAPNANIGVTPGGFKGMFVRWAATFIKDNKVPGYTQWFDQNVAAVLRHVNAAGLMNEDWSVKTGAGPLSAFSCSSAVVLLQWYPPVSRPAVTPVP